MLEILTGLIIVFVAYSYFREGLLTALATLVNVVISGLVAFNFFEPTAEWLASMMDRSAMEGYEDAFALFGLFIVPLVVLRWVTNNLANQEIEMPALVQQFGASAVGAVTGYLLAGFLLCILQTLPWGEHFLGFNTQMEKGTGGIRSVLPPDRVWLAMMSRASSGPLSQSDSPTFDPEGTFELRYAKLRRLKEAKE